MEILPSFRPLNFCPDQKTKLLKPPRIVQKEPTKPQRRTRVFCTPVTCQRSFATSAHDSRWDESGPPDEYYDFVRFRGKRGARETITYRRVGRLCATGRGDGLGHEAAAPVTVIAVLTAEAAAELLLEYRSFIQISETSIIIRRPVRVHRFERTESESGPHGSPQIRSRAFRRTVQRAYYEHFGAV